ncbi:hypothetical protein D3C78_1455350 [compost metagenome]
MPQPGAGGRDGLQPVGPLPDQRQQLGIPVTAAGVDQLTGGGIGEFAAQLAAQAVVQVVRDQQQAGGLGQPGRLLVKQRPDLV